MFSIGLLPCILSSVHDVYVLLSRHIQVRYSITRVHNLLWTLVIIIDIYDLSYI